MNALTRVQSGVPVPGTRQGNWVWDGQQWICGPCDDGGGFPGCPPPGFPPAGCPPWFSGLNSPPWYPGANAGVSFGTTPPANPVRGHFWWNGSMLAMFDGAVWVNTTNGAIISDGGGGSTGTGGVIISSTPPGNPVAGMQWWNGSQLQVFDGVMWKVVGPGGSAGPVPTTTRTFSIHQAPQVTASVNTWQVVPFNVTPSVDSTLAWNASTKDIRPTRAGTYIMFMRVFLNAPAGGWSAATLYKNDQGSVTVPTEVVCSGGAYNQSGSAQGFSSSGISVMNGTTDFVRLWYYASDGIFYDAGAPNIEMFLLP